MKNDIETAKKFIHDWIYAHEPKHQEAQEDGTMKITHSTEEILVAYADLHRPKWVSNEEIEKYYENVASASTLDQEPTYKLGWFHCAKWLRSKLFGEGTEG